MIRSKTRLLTPIAAAMAVALASSCAAASNSDNASQGYANSTRSSQQYNSTSSTRQADANNQNQKSSDAYREGQLWATYVINPALQSYRIKSDVQGNKATLSGTVDTKYEKLLAGTIAQQVKGISTVENDIKVDRSVTVVTAFIPVNAFAQHVRNATTSAEVNAQLLWSEYTDGLDIDVKTRDGKVTLSGVADTQKAKQRAGQIAASTKGVKSVDNQLSVSGEAAAKSIAMVNDDWISDSVRSSYMFTAGMDAADIDVDVNNGTVTLAGSVDSAAERRQAIAIAQHILGTKGVKADGLKVASDKVAMEG